MPPSQLLINYTNEVLQNIFNEIIFHAAQARCSPRYPPRLPPRDHHSTVAALAQAENDAEGLPRDAADAPSSSDHGTVSLLDAPRVGLFALLNEECIMPKGTDATFVHKLRAAGKSHPRLVGAKAESPTFAIVHYAGEVQYSSVGFLHKNKDPLSEDLQVLTRGSTEPLIAELFDASQQPSTRRRAGFRGVVIQFVADLAQLLKVRLTDGP